MDISLLPRLHSDILPACLFFPTAILHIYRPDTYGYMYIRFYLILLETVLPPAARSVTHFISLFRYDFLSIGSLFVAQPAGLRCF